MCNCTCAVGAPMPPPVAQTAGGGAPADAPAAPAPTRSQTSGGGGGGGGGGAANASAAQQAMAGLETLILPVGERRVTSAFGATESIRSRPHTGTDYSATTGTPIKAAASGKVIKAGWSNGGGGNVVTIDHGNGYYTSYAHQSKVRVKVGDTVSQGDVIGEVGSTGFSTGPHLHWELLKGGTTPGVHTIDVRKFMAQGGRV